MAAISGNSPITIHTTEEFAALSDKIFYLNQESAHEMKIVSTYVGASHFGRVSTTSELAKKRATEHWLLISTAYSPY